MADDQKDQEVLEVMHRIEVLTAVVESVQVSLVELRNRVMMTLLSPEEREKKLREERP